MFCKNCGGEIVNQQQYCKYCGAILDDERMPACKTSQNSLVDIKRNIKTMNMFSGIMMAPYVVIAIIIVLLEEWYHTYEGIMYFIGFCWPVVFVLTLFCMTQNIIKTSIVRKNKVNIHFVVSIIFLVALILGGIIMLILTYGMYILPVISGVLQLVISYKLKKQIVIS